MEVDLQTSLSTFFKFLRAWSFKTMASSRNGTPDLVACLPLTREQVLTMLEEGKTIGLFVAIEVKDESVKAKGRVLQEVQLRKIREAGGLAFVCNDLDEGKKILRNLSI